MVNSIQLAQDEYINAFSTNHWRDTIHSSVTSAQCSSAEADAAEDPDADGDAAEDNAEAEESPEPATTSAK